jgi:hypothetical protein
MTICLCCRQDNPRGFRIGDEDLHRSYMRAWMRSHIYTNQAEMELGDEASSRLARHAAWSFARLLSRTSRGGTMSSYHCRLVAAQRDVRFL